MSVLRPVLPEDDRGLVRLETREHDLDRGVDIHFCVGKIVRYAHDRFGLWEDRRVVVECGDLLAFDFLGFSETQFTVSANRFVHLELTSALSADSLLLRVKHFDHSISRLDLWPQELTS